VNRDNPYARGVLLDEAEDVHAVPLDVVHADAAEYLESVRAASFDAFALSNILDSAGPAYSKRLDAAVRHAAKPGAKAVLRSFAEPRDREEQRWAARDRALVWGRVRVWSPG
jgi:S-adenosylmethionine:diacylglycerol 3-amino-3-carboxypropyl transferase